MRDALIADHGRVDAVHVADIFAHLPGGYARPPPSDARPIALHRRRCEKLTRMGKAGADEWRNGVVAFVERFLPEPPVPILEVGCGDGWLTRHLAASRYLVRGIDYKFFHIFVSLN